MLGRVLGSFRRSDAGRRRRAAPFASAAAAAVLVAAGAGPVRAEDGAAKAVAAMQRARTLAAESRWDAAEDAAAEAVAALRDAGARERALLPLALNELAQILRAAGRLDAAAERAREADKLAGASGLPDRTAGVLAYNHGNLAIETGRPRVAVERLAAAAEAFERSGDGDLLRSALRALGEAELALDRPARALRAFRTAAGGAAPELEATLALRSAAAHLALDDVEAAESAAARAEALDPAGARSPQARLVRAEIALRRARYGDARDNLEELLDDPRLSGAERASALYKLGEAELMTGRYAEAEDRTRRALAAYLDAVGPTRRIVGTVLHRLAILRQEFGDHATAESLYARAEAVLAAALGSTHPRTLDTRIERVRLHVLMGRGPAAVAEARAVARDLAAAGDDAPGAARRAGIVAASLALALHAAGDLPAARDAALDAVAAFEGQGGRGRVDMAPSLNLLAEIALAEDRPDDAAAHARRAAGIFGAAGAAAPPRLSESRRLLAEALARTGETEQALALAAANAEAVEARTRMLAGRVSLGSEFRTAAARRQIGQYARLLMDRIERGGGADGATAVRAFGDRLFTALQVLNLNQSAGAFNAAAARPALDPAARELLERRQEIAGAMMARTALLERAVSGDPNAGLEAFGAAESRLQELEEALAEAEARLARAAPDYLDFAAPRPRPSAEVRAALAANEALWMNATFEDETILVLATREGLAFRRSQVGSGRLAGIVADLRRSVEANADGSPREFAKGAAEDLHRALFAPFGDRLARVSSLALVPDGAAQQIPLGLARREDGAYLGLETPLSVHPAAESLVARRMARTPRGVAPEPFVGFGDPSFEGGGRVGGPRASPAELRAALSSPRGFIEDPGALRRVFAPLPETAEELRIIGEVLGAASDAIHLGAAATESAVKSLDLSRADVLAFATHAVASGEFDGFNEPGIVLTPPAEGTTRDDGFLTASEIARLRLSARMVILSACNTGTPALRAGAEGLSGLSRAFFHAGARGLLVSHWPVDSLAAALLTTRFAVESARSPEAPAAEAFRRAMREVAGGGMGAEYAHPRYWAPFLVVGGG